MRSAPQAMFEPGLLTVIDNSNSGNFSVGYFINISGSKINVAPNLIRTYWHCALGIENAFKRSAIQRTRKPELIESVELRGLAANAVPVTVESVRIRRQHFKVAELDLTAIQVARDFDWRDTNRRI